MNLDNYFESGNIYVIDNNRSEAEPIINALYKHQLPHIYMDGGLKSLPSKPKQVRLIFLDLNLKDSVLDEKSFKSMHAGILNSLLGNNSGSYIVMVWSKLENHYLTYFTDLFVDKGDAYGLNDKRPLEIIPLAKGSFFNSIEDENSQEISYKWIEEKEEELFALIETKLNSNEAFKILSSWENIVASCGSKTVDYIFELVKSEPIGNKQDKLNNLITSLSISYLGIEHFNKADNQGKTDAFMLALSELIDDEIDKKIINDKNPEFTTWNPKQLKSNEKGKLNSKLLTSIENINPLLTGSVLKGNSKHDYAKMLFDSFDNDRGDSKKAINKKKRELFGTMSDSELNTHNLTLEQIKEIKNTWVTEVTSDQNKFVPIELNLTPLCDVVQNKEEYYRVVPGFLIQTKYRKFLFEDTDRNYFSPLLFSNDGLGEFMLVLDFRYLHAYDLIDINKMGKLCSLRKSFVDEIQLRLSNHVSRLGLLYLA